MLQVQNLYLKAGTFWLKNVSLAVDSNEYFVIIGPRGSGKSLFIKSICGLFKVKSGKIRINGEDITNAGTGFRGIGYVSQESILFPHLNVGKNITLPLDVSDPDSRTVKNKVKKIIEVLELEGLLSRNTCSLNSGEKIKVALARALTRSSHLLVLDEPSYGLDDKSKNSMCSLLKKVKKEFEVAALHVCHSVDEASRVSDRVGILCSGLLVQEGKLKDIMKNPADNTVSDILAGE